MESNRTEYLRDDLISEIGKKNALVVVGAGVSIHSTSGNLIASWKGLLQSGVERCMQVTSQLPNEWPSRVLAEIESGDLHDLLSAAEKISAKLSAPKGAEYLRWLRETVGRLTAAKTDLIEAISGLGIPVATTNYDSLIESVTGKQTVTWRQPHEAELVLRGDLSGVLHFHGHWRDAESVVLGIRSYEKILNDEHAQTMLQAMRALRTIVFIGFGAGLSDPNFGAMIQWSKSVFGSSHYRQFQLVRSSEVNAVQTQHGEDSRIHAISYGNDYEDLPAFVRGLVAKGRTSYSFLPSLSHDERKLPPAVLRFREFVARDWQSQWAGYDARDDDAVLPTFIQDQKLRVLRLRLKNTSPRRYLRVEYFRRLRAESSRQRNHGGQLRRLRRKPLRNHSATTPIDTKSEVWAPISREEIVLHLSTNETSSTFHRAVVATDAGVGKTTNMRWLHYALNSGGSEKLCLLMDVAHLPTNPNDLIPITLVSLLRQARGNDAYALSQEAAEAILYQLRAQGRLVLVIDALDQIHATERKCLHTLQKLLTDENWNQCHMVLGSRPFALERDWNLLFQDELARGWSFLHVEEFTEDQQRRYLGNIRYDAIPPDAREVLSIPRVLFYLKISDDQDLDVIRTASDVYWFATSKLLMEGLRATEAQDLNPAQIRLVLGAVAFEMVASGNFDEIQPHQMEGFIVAISQRCRVCRADATVDWTLEKLRQIAAMNEFLDHGMLEAGCPQQIQWRNRSLQEFFAGLWMSRYCVEADIDAFEDWIYQQNDPLTGDYYWVWRFATEMPLHARSAEVWVRSMRCLYRVRDHRSQEVKRSTEMIYRSWQTMARYATEEGETARLQQIANESLQEFATEFPAILNGRFGSAACRVAKQLLSQFRRIPGQHSDPLALTFRMGSPASEFGRGPNEPLLETKIRSSFELSCYLITQEQYALFDPTHTPWQHRRKSKRRRPAVAVSWFDAWVFCRWMGDEFRLPTEKEWEFACRAGTQTAFSFGDSGSRAHMRCSIHERQVLIPVGCLLPNPWGLFDMHGLAWEWSDSWYADNPELSSNADFVGEYRVIRGGAANTASHRARSAERAFRDPSDGTGLVGFRIARTPEGSDANEL